MADSNFTTAGASLDAVWTLTDGAVTRPTSWELALFSVIPSAAGGGTELSGDGYARQPVTLTEDGTGVASNDADLTFTANGGDWLPIVGAALFDDSATMRFVKEIDPAAGIVDGQDFVVRAGQLTVRYKVFA